MFITIGVSLHSCCFSGQMNICMCLCVCKFMSTFIYIYMHIFWKQSLAWCLCFLSNITRFILVFSLSILVTPFLGTTKPGSHFSLLYLLICSTHLYVVNLPSLFLPSSPRRYSPYSSCVLILAPVGNTVWKLSPSHPSSDNLCWATPISGHPPYPAWALAPAVENHSFLYSLP